MPKYRILCVAGARPNFMKVAPILRELREQADFDARLVHTGQHYDPGLSTIFFQELGIPSPDVSLDVGSGSHASQTAEIMRRFEPVLEADQPHVVLVVGDVNSTLACALVAAKFRLRAPFESAHGLRFRPLIAHVEAGLRSRDDDMPEEINRRVTDSISDLLFASEPSGVANLQREGVPPEKVFFVGNVMIDSLLAVRERARSSTILESLGVSKGAFGVVTLHRPSNVDDPDTLARLLTLLETATAGLRLVFPTHPRTRARLHSGSIALSPERWLIAESLGYVDFVRLIACARIVLTDSGGIQEETTVLGVPCVTLRDTTERPVTIEEGTNTLAGTSEAGIRRAVNHALNSPLTSLRPDLWDGKAASRIVGKLRESVCLTRPRPS